MTTIEQWNVVRRDDGQHCLVGSVSDHPRLGKPPSLASTTPLVAFDLSAGRARTRNTEYTLGTPSPTPRTQHELQAIHPWLLDGAVVLTGDELTALATALATVTDV